MIEPWIVRLMLALCALSAGAVAYMRPEHRRAALTLALTVCLDAARSTRPPSPLVHVPLYLAWPALAALASGLRARVVATTWLAFSAAVLLMCNGRPERMIAYAIAHACASLASVWLAVVVLRARRRFASGEVVALILGAGELSCAPLLLLPVEHWRAHVGVHSVFVWGFLLALHARWIWPWVSGLRLPRLSAA